MNNNSIINLKEALSVFSLKDEQGFFKPFNLEYRTHNSTTKKGGNLKEYLNVRYLPSAKKNKEAVFIALERPPNHFVNRTRNIELSTGEIKSIKIDFIISVNGKKVIY